jgi:hypothetical protein
MSDGDRTAGDHGRIEVGYDEQMESYRIECSGDVGQSISTCVVLGVAELSGLDPIELRRLDSIVDAEAIDQLFGPSNQGDPSDRVSFNYQDYRVTVYRDKEILLQARQIDEPGSREISSKSV